MLVGAPMIQCACHLRPARKRSSVTTKFQVDRAMQLGCHMEVSSPAQRLLSLVPKTGRLLTVVAVSLPMLLLVLLQHSSPPLTATFIPASDESTTVTSMLDET